MTVALRLRSSLILAGLAAAVAVGGVLPARAQMAPPVDSPRALETLARYNEATQAAILCRRPISMTEETRIAELASTASHGDYLAGSMLRTVDSSRGWMRMMVSSLGCKDPVVTDRLAFFDSQIEPRLR